MRKSSKSSSPPPGDELLQCYQSWRRSLPRFQELIKNPDLTIGEIRTLERRILNLKDGIENFEKLHPRYAVKDHRNSKVVQPIVTQIEIF